MENAEILKQDKYIREKELELSRKIQLALAPVRMPSVSGLGLESFFYPCGEVAGDMYDVIHLPGDKVGIYLFDVAGRGVSSALIASVAKVSFSRHIASVDSPVTLLNRVNKELLTKIKKDCFVRAFVCFVDLHNNRVRYANAGHTAPIYFSDIDKEVHFLKSTGKFLGLFEETALEEHSFYLTPRDKMLLFTDGFYQLWGGHNELQGREDLLKEINYSGENFINHMQDVVRKKTLNMVDENKLNDDITALFIEILTQSKRVRVQVEMGFDENDPVFLQYLSYYEEIDSVTGTILKDMDEIGYSDDVIRKMKLSLTELIANGISHGNGEDHSKKVTVGHIVRPKEVLVAIIDEGEGFDPKAVPDPTLPENIVKDHGRGIYIVSNYVDDLVFNKKGNRVLLRKTR